MISNGEPCQWEGRKQTIIQNGELQRNVLWERKDQRREWRKIPCWVNDKRDFMGGGETKTNGEHEQIPPLGRVRQNGNQNEKLETFGMKKDNGEKHNLVKFHNQWVTNVISNGQMKKRKRKTIPIVANGSPQMDLKHYRLSQNGKSKLRLNTKEEGFRQLVNDKRDFTDTQILAGGLGVQG